MISSSQRLTDVDLERIFQKYVKANHQVSCNENHVHGFDCVKFDDENIMLIERLRVEVMILRGKLNEISKIAIK